MTRYRERLAVLLPLTVLTLTGCSSSSGAASSMSSVSSGSAPTGTLTIFAAASLQKTFDEMKVRFTAANPGVTVKTIEYDGSSILVTQLENGADADVFASADDANMAKVSNLTNAPVEFASNELEIAVAPGNPKKITGLADLAKAGTSVVLCATGVPCGTAAQKALTAAKVTITPVSSEQNVTAVVTKIAGGEADAGLVYQTDVKANSGKIDGVNFPEAAQAVNSYPIATLKATKNLAAAQAFVALVTGAQGRQLLSDAGFGQP